MKFFIQLRSDRTTSACESFHAQFAKNFNASLPNIFEFTDQLKETHYEVRVLVRSASTEAQHVYRQDFLQKRSMMQLMVGRLLEDHHIITVKGQTKQLF